MDQHLKVRELIASLQDCNRESDIKLICNGQVFVVIGINYQPTRKQSADPFIIYVRPKNNQT
jgi:hypothetical protein